MTWSTHLYQRMRPGHKDNTTWKRERKQLSHEIIYYIWHVVTILYNISFAYRKAGKLFHETL